MSGPIVAAANSAARATNCFGPAPFAAAKGLSRGGSVCLVPVRAREFLEFWAREKRRTLFRERAALLAWLAARGPPNERPCAGPPNVSGGSRLHIALGSAPRGTRRPLRALANICMRARRCIYEASTWQVNQERIRGEPTLSLCEPRLATRERFFIRRLAAKL